ncbi:MAG: isochorismatase family protein [Muribaculaceae bacterium]|nr:isochorismatase family protein [Muribaculaceae bacterium]
MKGKEKRLLLIVDPQIDFITGTLPVPNARPAMDALAEYVDHNGNIYDLICVTCDRHPLRHSSFSDYGGQWPSHCVESSVGAAIWTPLMKALEKHSDTVRFLYKGESLDKDEYSIFLSSKGATEMERLIKVFDIEEIDICGLAGDVCVANTLRDAFRLYPNIRFRILDNYTASLDGGTLLASLNIY